MKNKIIILEIIRDNQPLGIHKFDRLFYDKVDFSISWLPLMNELRDDGLIQETGYEITEKGLDYIINKK